MRMDSSAPVCAIFRARCRAYRRSETRKFPRTRRPARRPSGRARRPRAMLETEPSRCKGVQAEKRERSKRDAKQPKPIRRAGLRNDRAIHALRAQRRAADFETRSAVGSNWSATREKRVFVQLTRSTPGPDKEIVCLTVIRVDFHTF